jgi:putative flippase GtrA
MLSARIREFLRYCIVGGLGFLVDAGCMELGILAGLAAPEARILSILTALQCTFLLHSMFTFKTHNARTRSGWSKFMLSNLTGAMLNYLIFLVLLFVLPIPDALLLRQCALAGGVSVALFFNYWANRRFVFREKDAQ